MSHEVRALLAKALGLDEERVRVVVPDVGRGASARSSWPIPKKSWLACATRMLGRPLKWIEDRREHFLSAIQARTQFWQAEVAGRRRRHDPRGPRSDDARSGRLHPAGLQPALQRVGGRARSLRGAGLQHGSGRRGDESTADDSGTWRPVTPRRRSRWSGCSTPLPVRSALTGPRSAAAISSPSRRIPYELPLKTRSGGPGQVRQRRLSGLPGPGARDDRLRCVSGRGRRPRGSRTGISASASRTGSRVPGRGAVRVRGGAPWADRAMSACTPARSRWVRD